jgi:hypothetical protein
MKISKNNNSILIAIAFSALTIMFFMQGFETFHYIIGLFFLVLSVIAFSYKSGLEITKASQMRNYISIFGRSFGKWINLPEIEYVSVVRVNRNRWIATGGFLGQEQSNNKIYNVKLILNSKSQKYIKLISTSKEKALAYAIEIGNLIDLKVLDYTESSSKWIK